VAPLPPGIAVPVCVLPACRQALAGSGVELLPALMRVATDEAAVQLASPREQRRDTPPQHIAARHHQAEAVVRAEVAALLQKRGSGIAALMRQQF
jgi:hypothetical protein